MSDQLVLQLGTLHPDMCPDCKQHSLSLREGQWGAYYKCDTPGCEGTATAADDGRPLGKAVNTVTRANRVVIHKLLDKVKHVRGWNNSKVYDWLGDIFNATRTPHIADMDYRQLRIVCREAQKLIKR